MVAQVAQAAAGEVILGVAVVVQVGGEEAMEGSVAVAHRVVAVEALQRDSSCRSQGKTQAIEVAGPEVVTAALMAVL